MGIRALFLRYHHPEREAFAGIEDSELVRYCFKTSTQGADAMTSLCTWCGNEFEPRSNGGSTQRFCAKDCRENFNTACRIWAAREYQAERVSIFDLRTCLEQRARSLQRDPAPEGARPTRPAREHPGAPAAAQGVEARG